MKAPVEFTRKWNRQISGLDKPMYEIHTTGTMVKKYKVTYSPSTRELVFYKDYKMEPFTLSI